MQKEQTNKAWRVGQRSILWRTPEFSIDCASSHCIKPKFTCVRCWVVMNAKWWGHWHQYICFIIPPWMTSSGTTPDVLSCCSFKRRQYSGVACEAVGRNHSIFSSQDKSSCTWCNNRTQYKKCKSSLLDCVIIVLVPMCSLCIQNLVCIITTASMTKFGIVIIGGRKGKVACVWMWVTAGRTKNP